MFNHTVIFDILLGGVLVINLKYFSRVVEIKKFWQFLNFLIIDSYNRF